MQIRLWLACNNSCLNTHLKFVEMASIIAVKLLSVKMNQHLNLPALWAVPREKRKKAVIVLLSAVTLLQSNVCAQVANDNIQHRLELPTDGNALVSNTTGCTVQWACVDQRLTGKCIQYHNDQWFFFHSGVCWIEGLSPCPLDGQERASSERE